MAFNRAICCYFRSLLGTLTEILSLRTLLDLISMLASSAFIQRPSILMDLVLELNCMAAVKVSFLANKYP